MAQTQSPSRTSGITCAVSNTGPLISAFQSNSFPVLTRIFPTIVVPVACAVELENHGWVEETHSVSGQLVIAELTPDEQRRATSIAEQIAKHPDSNDPIPEAHLGEAQSIVLALRPEYAHDLLLLDELAARAIAKQTGMKISGFPGALLLATQAGIISAEELKTKLEICREKGTHYGALFVQQVYNMAKQGRR